MSKYIKNISKISIVLLIIIFFVNYIIIIKDNFYYEYFYVKLFDNYDKKGNISFNEILENEDSSEKFKKFNLELHEKFDYIEIITQPVEYIDPINKYDLPLDFVNGYIESNKEEDLSNQQVNLNGIEYYITPVNAIQVDLNAYLKSGFKINNGREFNNDDFIYKDYIPVLLGNNYNKYFQLNDNLEFYYLSKKLNAVVIGFLAENAYSLQNDIYLDNYIMMPFLEFEIGDLNKLEYITVLDNKDFMTIYYSTKNSGYILFNNITDNKKIKKEIINIANDLGLSYDITFVQKVK